MKIESTAIPDVKRLTPKRWGDERGYFVEVFNSLEMNNAGIKFSAVQENQSLSFATGTVRGLHFQVPPYAQAKIVRVLRGKIFDVAVDIRFGSPSYGQFIAEELSAENGVQLFIPRGFAHGFCTLEIDTEISYLIDNPYAPECDRVIAWNDQDISIVWPEGAGSVLSAKDSEAPKLRDVEVSFNYS